jgi:hypothetical protein
VTPVNTLSKFLVFLFVFFFIYIYPYSVYGAYICITLNADVIRFGSSEVASDLKDSHGLGANASGSWVESSERHVFDD